MGLHNYPSQHRTRTRPIRVETILDREGVYDDSDLAGVHRKKSWTPSLDAPQVYLVCGHWMRSGHWCRYDASRVLHPKPSEHQQKLSLIRRPR